MKPLVYAFVLLQGALAGGRILRARPALSGAESGPDFQPWNLSLQGTSIVQLHRGLLSSPGWTNGLSGSTEQQLSLTGTISADLRVRPWLHAVVNPEVATWAGFEWLTGIAGFTNAEIPGIAAGRPAVYCARAYLRAAWPIGADGGGRSQHRLTVITGKFALSDFFDNNAYSHDARTQFMNWSIMNNGAWE